LKERNGEREIGRTRRPKADMFKVLAGCAGKVRGPQKRERERGDIAIWLG